MRSVLATMAIAAAVAAPVPVSAGDGLLYYVEDGRVVITNTPSRPDVRPVPGFEERVTRAMRGELPATPWDRTISIVARRNGLSPDLVKAVAVVESGLDPAAVSPKGAIGLMQLMPATARRYGVTDPLDPDENLAGGARHLRDLLDEFDGDLNLALAAYNAGAGAVRRYGGVPAYRETRNYVDRVTSRLDGRGSRAAPRVRSEPEPTIQVRRLDDGSVLIAN